MRSAKFYLICLFPGISGIISRVRAQKDSYYFEMEKAPGVKEILTGWPVSWWVTHIFLTR